MSKNERKVNSYKSYCSWQEIQIESNPNEPEQQRKLNEQVVHQMEEEISVKQTTHYKKK